MLLVLAGAFTACLLAEVGIRSLDAVRGRGFFSQDRRNIKKAAPVIPFRMFGFMPYQERNGTRYIASRHGELYPLHKPAGTFRIVCFGGSTTENESSFKAHGTHYPLVLQSLLRARLHNETIEVINVGNSAYATPQALIFLELDVLSWDPEVVILSENFNDLLAAYWPNFTYDYSHKYAHPFYTNSGAGPQRCLEEVSDRLFQRSQLYWVAKERLLRVLRRRFPLHRRSYGDIPDPVAAGVFRRNLRSFVTLARSNGIQVVLGTQPLQPSEESFLRHVEYKPYNDVVVYPLHEEFVKHHQYYNEVIRQVGAAEGVPVADSASALGSNPKYFIDFLHYSEEGVEALARYYADFLIEQKIVR